jgi:glycosyltransferase involved in cell wall biosynthesis
MSTSNNPSHSSKYRGARTVILHLCADLESGEPGRETVDLAILTQRATGWRALIGSSGGALVKEAERAAVRHRKMPLDGNGMFTDWRNRLRLESLIQKERPSLLHAHGAAALPFAYAVSRTHRMPLAVDLTQPPPDTKPMRRLMDNIRMAHSLIRVPSEFMGTYMHETWQFEAEQMRLVPPGVDLQWHGAGFVSPERLHKLSHLWRLPEQASVVLVPMPLEPGLGHKSFLEALARIRSENVFALLVGSDRAAPGMRAEIEAMVETLGLNGHVVMPESCPDWPAACWLASVVVTPNITPRGQSQELLAAQAVGRPAIVTDSGANREMAVSGETAWVVPPDDVTAMANAIREAINLNTDQRLTLAERTHDFIAESFPQQVWFEGMMEMYETLMQPPKRVARSQAA